MGRVHTTVAIAAVIAGAAVGPAHAATTDPALPATAAPTVGQRLVAATGSVRAALIALRERTPATTVPVVAAVRSSVDDARNMLTGIDPAAGLGLDPLIGADGSLTGAAAGLTAIARAQLSATTERFRLVDGQLASALNQLASIDPAAGLGIDPTLDAVGSLTAAAPPLVLAVVGPLRRLGLPPT